MIFRMPRAFAVDLTESFDVVERDRWLAETLVFGIDRLHAAEMQHRIEQHRGMPLDSTKRSRFGQIGSSGSKRRKCCQTTYDHRRQSHRRTGVAGIGLLHGIHRQRANRVNAELIDAVPGSAM